MKQPVATDNEKKRSIWGPELLLVIGLPLSVIVAGVITVVIAVNHGFKADSAVKTDRFARIQEPRP